MVQRFGPLMNPGGSVISLTYNASNLTIPGYGGGMSSAKAVSEGQSIANVSKLRLPLGLLVSRGCLFPGAVAWMER